MKDTIIHYASSVDWKALEPVDRTEKAHVKEVTMTTKLKSSNSNGRGKWDGWWRYDRYVGFSQAEGREQA